MSYFRENIDKMTPYVPGAQPAPGERIIKLNTNENPYPPSPAAVQAMRDLDPDLLRRYPDPMARRFCQAISDVLEVPVDRVLPGNGSDDILVMISRACLQPGKKVAFAIPTFEFYEVQANIENATCVPIDCDPIEAAQRLADADADVTFVASPNSPTGVLTPIDVLDDLAGRLTGLLVIDEAYADFSSENALTLAAEHDNVIILRTLSKGYSLAGLRMGFAVSQPAILDGLLKTKAIYNVDAVACAAATAAILDQDHKNANARKVIASREALGDELAELGFTFPASEANFLLVRPPIGNAAEIYEALKARGILVRYFQQNAILADKLRITIGTDDQNAALVAALKEIMA
ncbi:MAG: histidinol-phosphate transaminase [Phycisphaerae bacterium]|jgi:histidinol-phosphate aminotransferase|nr:histidinol-phosphate transaminase [Phycisphaerae bacterium]MDP7287721.1 histidinol-phosphate transaminase [Phycisphaerae bacterium]